MEIDEEREAEPAERGRESKLAVGARMEIGNVREA